ncbi:copper amine oxidase N-terminal domain-containing protein [Desulfofundulus australicus]|uniref:copper amine oxidase N-terminal domain-containing protein n=1 Tax=Desulfofundulus australicus TaxID=1566 RepID=UPI0013F4FB1C|nr:copper amine oxidase N-terminal domain-containing protein [Desulfofundulus australicus]
MNKLMGNDGYLYLYLKNVKIPAGESGDVVLVATAPSTSGFSSGEVVVGKIRGDVVLVSVDEVKTFTDDTTVVLRFKESVKNAFEIDSESIKLRLPDGFEWSSVGTPTLIWGDSNWLNDKNSFEIVRDGRDLYLDVKKDAEKGMYFSVPLGITVEDETKAKTGDVTVTISGATDTDPTSLVVARYGEMGANVSAAETPEIIAGKTEQEIGDIVIEETAPGSLIKGRTITLTLPANAKWGKLPSVDTENDIDIDNSKGYNGFATVGKDGRTLKFWIGDESSDDPGKITLEDAEVILSGDVTGDLNIEVGGTAGVKGSVTVAKVVPPVVVKAAATPDVKIGLNDQAAGDIEIVESIAGAIADDENIELWLPSGVTFSAEPTVEVTAGDLDIDEDNISLTDGDSRLIIPVDAESTTASTIKISGIEYDVDRTVPVGSIKVKVGGLAVNEVNDIDTLDDYYAYDDTKQNEDNYYVFGAGDTDEQIIFKRDEDGAFPGDDEVATVVNANVVTPAPGEQKATVVFKVGDTKFTLNGVEQTMDVAPYIKNGRTYIPVRYSAQAVGVAAENILYNGGKVTLIKGDKVVQFTIGSNVMLINGVAVTMDVKAEVTSGRTMLPFRYVAQALGAQVNWDPTTQTVTMNL